MHSRHRAKLNQQPSSNEAEEERVDPVENLRVAIDSLANSLRQKTKAMNPASTWHAIKRFAHLCDGIKKIQAQRYPETAGGGTSSCMDFSPFGGRNRWTRIHENERSSLVRLKDATVKASNAHKIFRVALSGYVH